MASPEPEYSHPADGCGWPIAGFNPRSPKRVRCGLPGIVCWKQVIRS